MRIIDLQPGVEDAIRQTATLLLEGFAAHSPQAYPDLEAALAEVQESFGEDRISRIAVDEDGTILGWIGAISQYGGRVWELHPLVVKIQYQRKGVGRALVTDLEACVRSRGGLTITLGADDEDDQTSLSGINLYPDVWEHIKHIRNFKSHPYEFYQKLGYVIVGVVPEANGIGKPDILMAKSVV